MTKIIIKAEKIGKKYKIGAKKPDTLHESVVNYFRRNPKENEYWALKNINFEINEGDVLGIIGANGSGKSTLLKILSRTTPPTEGTISIDGKVSALLEVGTGFHPELTGRENIFLNGAILGMTRKEIKNKFDEIVNFADIGKFLDTPVKHYSSGMYVRLAFAIAAYMNPEILIIDEVLAVGDANFQKKCIGKIEAITKSGKTVIFVSHSMQMIETLCNKAVLLEDGKIKQFGRTSTVIEKYYAVNESAKPKAGKKSSKGDEIAQFLEAKVLNSEGKKQTNFYSSEDIIIEWQYQILKNNQQVVPNMHVYSSSGAYILTSSDLAIGSRAEPKTKAGKYLAKCVIPGNLLNHGVYYIGIAVSTLIPVKVHFYKENYLRIKVTNLIKHRNNNKLFHFEVPGLIHPELPWESRRLK